MRASPRSGILVIASAVALALTPRPLTMSAMRGASGLPAAVSPAGQRLPRPRSIGGDFWDRAMRRHFDEVLIWRGSARRDCRRSRLSGITTSWRAPGLAVDDGDGLGARRMALTRRRRFRRRTAEPRHHARRTPVRSGQLRTSAWPQVFSRRSSPCRSIGTAATGSPPNGLSADDRPSHENSEEQQKRSGNDLRSRDWQLAPTLHRLLAQRRAQIISRHGAVRQIMSRRIMCWSLSCRPRRPAATRRSRGAFGLGLQPANKYGAASELPRHR